MVNQLHMNSIISVLQSEQKKITNLYQYCSTKKRKSRIYTNIAVGTKENHESLSILQYEQKKITKPTAFQCKKENKLLVIKMS